MFGFSLQIVPENVGNRISEALKLKIFWGSMPPGPPLGATAFGGRLSEPHPLRQFQIRPSFQYIERSRSRRLVVSFDIEDSFF